MKLKIYIAIGLFCFFLVSCMSTKPQLNKDIKKGIKSDYIFVGKVIKQGASNVSFVEENNDVYLVQVKKVIKASGGYEHFENSNITVKTGNVLKLRPNKSYIIFSNIWLFGESLAVIANQVELNLDKITEIKDQTKKYEIRAQDNKLMKRLESAQSVIVGKVVKIIKPDFYSKIKLSEHLPNWMVAEIAIEDILKGEERTQFVFSDSRDVQWYQSPKFKIGQEGIFILHSSKENEIQGYYQLINPLDFKSKDQLERIKKLIK